MDDQIVIIEAKRTVIGNFLGALSTMSAIDLGATAIKACMQSKNLKNPVQINQVLMGCVLAAGLGQAPARQAALQAGLATHIGATTINKMCGSGMQAIIFAHDILKANAHDFAIVAGGMESMSNAPYLLPKARLGYRMGNQLAIDHLLHDGLIDAHGHAHMGEFAELTAKKFHISRQAQDEFAKTSVLRAQYAVAENLLENEIIAVEIQTKTESIRIKKDEGPTRAKIEKIPHLKPAFAADGSITAANASSIADGAAALLLSSASYANKIQAKPIAKILAYSHFAQNPKDFPSAPVDAIKNLLQKMQWQIHDVDLFEINEAFAVVPLVAMQCLNLDPEKVNVLGGACVLGHPIGASGARIVVTLLNALKIKQKRLGIASICIGGGEALAIAVALL